MIRFLNLFFFILFVASAALQYNDPDPFLWMPLYLYGAVLCYLAFRNKYYRSLYLIGIIVYTALAIYYFFTKDGLLDWYREHNAENLVQSMKATKPWIEATREFLGLLLLMIAMLMNVYTSKNQNRKQS